LIRCIVASALCLFGCATASKLNSAAPQPPPSLSVVIPSLANIPDLRPRDDLPREVREVLDARMQRHGEQMTDLMVYVVLLQYEVVRVLAAELAKEPRLGRPARGESGTVSALLPEKFFQQQDALLEASRALSRAATEHDEQGLLSSFSSVTRTCVSCHATYLTADFHVLDHDEPEESVPCDVGDACDEADD
ncbi:MAG: uncharacterized protein JWN04_6375, partial [Myxococcaceae bacterium]|nr:uncharacterized protein [Myxococcaceae bacterium]